MTKIQSIAFVFILSIGQSLYAQDLSSLTDAGYAHWVAANRLTETADDMTEYLLAASELEAVVNSDPQFKDSYMKLVHLYEKIAMEQGEPVFIKADQLLDKYLSVFPEEGRAVMAEKTYINALRDKYRVNVPMSFVGKWRYDSLEIDMEIFHSNGYFTATIDSDNKNKREVLSITQEKDYLILVYKVTYDGIANGDIKKIEYLNGNIYNTYIHDCGGHQYKWTKNVKIITKKLYEEDGKKYSLTLEMKNIFYSQYGIEIHSCYKNYGHGKFKTELHKYL